MLCTKDLTPWFAAIWLGHLSGRITKAAHTDHSPLAVGIHWLTELQIQTVLRERSSDITATVDGSIHNCLDVA